MKTKRYLNLLFLLGILLTGCHKEENIADANWGGDAGMLRIAFVSDLHYMAPELLIQDGPAFHAYQSLDPKLLIESPVIIQQFIKQLNVDKPDLLIISGDITKDGELVGHQQFIEMLQTRLDSKIKVLLLPGNHDIANPDALSYNGDVTSTVPTVTKEEFVNMYEDFGYGDAISRDAATLSYVAEPFENFWVIFIDATIRPNPADPNEPPLEGEITAETLNWIEMQMVAAKANNIHVIAVMHQNLIEHWTTQSVVYSGYVINNSQEAAYRLYQAGIELIFTGHSHSNDITKYWLGELYDIETGSAVCYPLPYRFIKYWNNGTPDITTKYIRGIELYGFPVEVYAQTFLNNCMTKMFDSVLTNVFSVTEPLATQVAQLETNAFIELNVGDEVLTPEEESQRDFYVSTLTAGGFPLAAASFYASFNTWNTDLAPQDNNIKIDLKQSKIK